MKRIITTGGTIDKTYNPLQGTMGFEQSAIPAMLTRARVTFPYIVEQLMQLDSLDMTDDDRDLIARACKDAWESAIIVTHGTDTMVETGRLIKERMDKKLGEKTIILTGAMIPYRVEDSDALANLGYALAAADFHAPGVYIAMNGQVLDVDEAVKDREQGVFIRRSLTDELHLS